MKDAIVALSKDDHLVPGLLQELAPPVLPADGLASHRLALTLQPIRGRQREQQHGEYHMHPYRPFVFLRGMAQPPLLLRFLDTTVLDEATVVIIIEDLQGLGYRGIGQEHGFPPPAHSP